MFERPNHFDLSSYEIEMMEFPYKIFNWVIPDDNSNMKACNFVTRAIIHNHGCMITANVFNLKGIKQDGIIATKLIEIQDVK